MKKLLSVVAVTAAVFTINNAMATAIDASVTGLAGATTITFGTNSYATGTVLTNQYQSSGITFNSNTFYYDNSYFSSGAIRNFGGPITPASASSIFFTSTVTAADFNFISNPGSTLFEAYLTGTLVESFTATTSNIPDSLFYGFQNISFNEIRINAQVNDALVLDNLQVKASAVPEPTTVALLGLGLLGVAASRRKATKK